jgi:hypothetical protein
MGLGAEIAVDLALCRRSDLRMGHIAITLVRGLSRWMNDLVDYGINTPAILRR